ncbi:hypothetical protein C8Q76DRAFT_797631 [Earliella scabrosa]|nr:hypothetical protein C8Q76DRAFT_797631 [Earliella scabrosa]
METKEETKARVQRTVELLSSLKEAQEQDRDTRPPMRKVFWTVANRYVHKLRPRNPGLTLVLLHGIGAHKETWEPIIKRLLKLLHDCNTSIHIQEIWALDCVQHGDSALLNEAVMGDTFDCAEYARDLTNFLLAYLPEDVSLPGALPTNLVRLPDFSRSPGVRSKESRDVPSSALAIQSERAPFLVESFTIPEYIKHLDTHRKNEALCMSRRWSWSSREEALNALRNNPYYRTWDPQALEQFFQFALVQLPDGTVRTKLHPYLESLMLFERRVVYETWELLEDIDPSIAMHWVWGGKSGRQGGPLSQAQTSFRRPINSTNDFHPDVGHLLPQEAPDLLASDLARFLLSRYELKRSRL